MPPFVATLGMLFVFRGIAYILTEDSPAVLPYSEIDSGFAQLGSTRIAQVPLPFILMCLFFAAAYVFLRRTASGRRVVAYGSSPEAARYSGVSAARVRLLVFGLLGLAVGVAVLTYITRIWTADGATQDGFELRVITAAVLGGASLQGGKGSLVGTFSAVLLVAVLNDLMVGQGVAAGIQQMVLGGVLILALGIDGVRTKYAHRVRALLSAPPSGRAGRGLTPQLGTSSSPRRAETSSTNHPTSTTPTQHHRSTLIRGPATCRPQRKAPPHEEPQDPRGRRGFPDPGLERVQQLDGRHQRLRGR